MSKHYVPDEVNLICSEGREVRQLKVTSQQTIKIAGDKLAATLKDRINGNFYCAKMIIIGAILGAIGAAIFGLLMICTGGTVAMGLGMLMAAGAAAGAAGGGILSLIPSICSFFTMSHEWAPVHPTVEFESKKALIESSRVSCILGGYVLIQYSKEAAEAAVALKKKETLIDVGAIIGAAYIAAPAIEGVATSVATASGIFSGFGARAGLSYLGSLGLGFATNQGLDLVKSKVKSNVYKWTGIDKYVNGYETDIVKIEDSMDVEGGEKNTTYDDLRKTAKSVDKGRKAVGDRTSSYESLDYESRTVVTDKNGSVAEVNSDRVSTEKAGGIKEKNPTVSTSRNSDFYSDRSGVYMHDETYTMEQGKQYNPAGIKDSGSVMQKTVANWGKDQWGMPKGAENFSGERSFKNGPSGGGLVMDLLTDGYRALTNALLKGDIENYIKALSTSEATARASIKVVEDDV